LFIGDDALIGQAEITQENLEALVQRYATTGAGWVWEACGSGAAVPPQRSPTAAVVLAGLLDGLNPCAFATLIFSVSYLTASERCGWEILAVGIGLPWESI
jgi:cytochrome c biogenesis protein CcdA